MRVYVNGLSWFDDKCDCGIDGSDESQLFRFLQVHGIYVPASESACSGSYVGYMRAVAVTEESLAVHLRGEH